eukprot:364604-Chlamydomonas_euryale.AAC.2
MPALKKCGLVSRRTLAVYWSGWRTAGTVRCSQRRSRPNLRQPSPRRSLRALPRATCPTARAAFRCRCREATVSMRGSSRRPPPAAAVPGTRCRQNRPRRASPPAASAAVAAAACGFGGWAAALRRSLSSRLG